MRDPGRFTISENMPCYPGMDIIHNAPDGPVFTTGVDLENFDGVVYIRVADVVEMAEMLGMASIEEVTELRNKIESLTKEVEVLPTRIGAFTDELSELVSRFHANIGDRNLDLEFQKQLEITKSNVEDSDRAILDSLKLDGQESGFTLLKGLDDLSADTSNESPSGKPKT